MTIVLIKNKTNSLNFNINVMPCILVFVRLFDIKFNINVMPCILVFIRLFDIKLLMLCLAYLFLLDFDIKFNINVMPCILVFINVLWYIKTNSSLGIRILTEVYVPKLLLFVTGGEAK